VIEPEGTNTQTNKHTHIHTHNIKIYKGRAIYVSDQTWNYKHENKRTHTHTAYNTYKKHNKYILGI